MLTARELITLEETLREARVLSVYVDGGADDFADLDTWRLKLDHSLRDLREWLAGSSHAEREEFERCVLALEEQLAPFPRGIRAPGWVGFITDGEVRYADRLPVPMSTVAVWSTGACIAPYMRALKQTRPVAIAIADRRKCTIYRYQQGKLQLKRTVHALAHFGPVSHMGDTPRVGFHGGVRGAAGRDEEQRVMLEGTRRMLKAASEALLALGGEEGWIITGGIPRRGGELAKMLARSARGRVLHLESLDVHASESEIVKAAEDGSSTLRDAFDSAQVDDLVKNAGGRGVAALGPARTREALQQSRVGELYLTHSFIEDHAAEAEDVVRTALQQGALVEEVSRGAAVKLNSHGGVAARLRYRV
jgi:hypothetical protein